MKTKLILLLLLVLGVVVLYLFQDRTPLNPFARHDRPARDVPKPEWMTVQVYFSDATRDPEEQHCEVVYPFKRRVLYNETAGRVALDELLKGPSEEERELGVYSSINPGVVIRRLDIRDGTATVDLSGRVEEGAAGSCNVTAIRAQIAQTLQQFPTVKRVELLVDGKAEGVLQP